MSAQNSAGIQTLLDAEREAQKIVEEDRTKRVKDARAEAQKEIEEYRKAKHDEFKSFENEHTSGNKKAEEDAKKRADVESKAIMALLGERNSIAIDLRDAVTGMKSEALPK